MGWVGRNVDVPSHAALDLYLSSDVIISEVENACLAISNSLDMLGYNQGRQNQ